MQPSPRYKALENRLQELRRHLLPGRFSNTGTYTARVLDLARGYRVLVHAEIESYLEDRAWDIVLDGVRSWKRDRKPRHIITALVAFCARSADAPVSLDECVDAASRGYKYVLAKNNGIKEDDILRVLQPLGIERADLDGTWLSTLSSFGTLRGEVAHSSSKVHQPIDPRSERDTVKQLLSGLRDVDGLIESIR